MVFEAIKVGAPHAAVRSEPVVELRQWFGTDAIEAALGVGADFHHAGVLQDTKVLGNRGLAEMELIHQFAHRPFPITDRLDNRLAMGLTQDLERGKCGHESKNTLLVIYVSRYV